MAKTFVLSAARRLCRAWTACPNCGRRIEPDEPDRMAEPPQAQAQDGTRDAGQSGQESGRRARSRLAGVPVREAGAGEPRQAGRLDEPPVTVPAGKSRRSPDRVRPCLPSTGQEEAYPYPPQGGSPVGAAPRPIYMPPRPGEHPVRAFRRPLMRSGLPIIRPACKATDSRNCPNRYPWAPISECPFLGMVPVIGLVFLLVWALDSPAPTAATLRGAFWLRVSSHGLCFCIDVRAVFDNGGGVPGFFTTEAGKETQRNERGGEWYIV